MNSTQAQGSKFSEEFSRVCAVVVAYNRHALLRQCLLSLQAQTRAVDTILVVDNASTDITRQMLSDEFPDVQVLALPSNVGGAGGFHEGMRRAYEQGEDWMWLMDDDARPAPDCLAKLLTHRRPNSVLVPVQEDSGGRMYGVAKWQGRHIDVTAELVARGQATCGAFVFAFVGPLIRREIVEQVGLPNKDFFIWFDDYEYALRIHSRTQAEIVFVPDAIMFHDFGSNTREVRFLGIRSTRSHQPAWKLYYGARNPLYTFLNVRRKPIEIFLFLLVNLRLMLLDIVYETDRWERVKMRLKGFRDGVTGKLGKRV